MFAASPTPPGRFSNETDIPQARRGPCLDQLDHIVSNRIVTEQGVLPRLASPRFELLGRGFSSEGGGEGDGLALFPVVEAARERAEGPVPEGGAPPEFPADARVLDESTR
jgi:hypothetical protein